MRLKGLYHTWWVKKDRTRVYYYYAFKGGPLIWRGDKLPEPLPPDHPVIAAWQEGQKAGRRQKSEGLVSGLVTDFKGSAAFLALADSTKEQWRRWLDRIEDEFGELEVEGLDDRAFRKEIINWRDRWKDTPRQADYAIQVMSRLLSFGKDMGELDFNRAAGIGRLSKANTRADLIWTDDDIRRVCEDVKTTRETTFAIRLAAVTGLRRGDLINLRWDEVGGVEIVRATRKSRGQNVARVPLLAETRTLLDEIRKAAAERKVSSIYILTTPGGRQWSENYLTREVHATSERNHVHRRLHDLRGTFVTRLATAGLTDQEIADVAGWSTRAVARLRRTYVSAEKVAQATIHKLRSNAG